MRVLIKTSTSLRRKKGCAKAARSCISENMRFPSSGQLTPLPMGSAPNPNHPVELGHPPCITPQSGLASQALLRSPSGTQAGPKCHPVGIPSHLAVEPSQPRALPDQRCCPKAPVLWGAAEYLEPLACLWGELGLLEGCSGPLSSSAGDPHEHHHVSL